MGRGRPHLDPRTAGLAVEEAPRLRVAGEASTELGCGGGGNGNRAQWYRLQYQRTDSHKAHIPVRWTEGLGSLPIPVSFDLWGVPGDSKSPTLEAGSCL